MKQVFILGFLLCAISLSANKDRWDAHKIDWSPLMLHIYNHQNDSAKALIESGVDVNYISPNPDTFFQLTALDIALRMNNEECVYSLLNTNKVKLPEESLITACGGKSAKNVDMLIKYGGNPNDTLENGYSALMMASSFGTLEILRCMIEHGADVNHARSGGMTPLMFAAYNGDAEKVKFLLENGADKNKKALNEKGVNDYLEEGCIRYNISAAIKAQLRDLLK